MSIAVRASCRVSIHRSSDTRATIGAFADASSSDALSRSQSS
jgi:hypothetical protein